MSHIAVDFETFYLKGDYDIKALGAAAYVRDPRFDCYLISVSDGEQSWAGHPNEFNWESLAGRTLVSHNAGFDSRVYRELVLRGKAPQVEFADWICTANLSAFLCMRRDIARAAEFLLGSVVDKSYRTDANGKTWDDMVKAGVGEKVKEAGRVDALRCWQLWQRFGHLWPEAERKLSALTIRQCQRGVQIDVPNLERQIVSAQKSLIETESKLPWVAEGKPKTSSKAIAERCRAAGIPCPPVKSTEGEEAFELWYSQYAPRFEWVKAVADWRQINKYLGQLETIKGRLFEAGILPFDMLYFGAHTGRWSGSGGLNMQNLRKAPLVVSGKSLDVRSLFVARPGKKLIVSDLSQIEPRVLSWLVGDQKMLDLMAAGKSPYQAHAETTMNWTRGDMKALVKAGDQEAKDLYALAKARVLGLGYGCGFRKFITMAQTLSGIDITLGDPEFVQATNDEGELCVNAKGEPIMVSGEGFNSRRIVKEFRDSNPLIAGPKGIWRRLDDAFRASIGKDFEMELPSGRSLRYPEVQKELKRIPDPERPGKWLTKSCYTALTFDQQRNGVVRKSLYGGLLTENVTQAVARDVFGDFLIALDETPGIKVLWHVHDEVILECDPEITVEQVTKIMSRTPACMPGLPVACEAEEVLCYKK